MTAAEGKAAVSKEMNARMTRARAIGREVGYDPQPGWQRGNCRALRQQDPTTRARRIYTRAYECKVLETELDPNADGPATTDPATAEMTNTNIDGRVCGYVLSVVWTRTADDPRHTRLVAWQHPAESWPDAQSRYGIDQCVTWGSGGVIATPDQALAMTVPWLRTSRF